MMTFAYLSICYLFYAPLVRSEVLRSEVGVGVGLRMGVVWGGVGGVAQGG